MPAIFLSYRRDDTKWITGRIFDRLEQHYGKGHVLMDVDAIPVGMDFREHLHGILSQCDVLVAIIGPKWVAPDVNGKTRILDATDWVRIEIETALSKKIPVIPVLVDGTRMPSPGDLPPSLEAFAYRQAADLDSGRDFHPHMDRLIRAIAQSASRKLGPQTSQARSSVGDVTPESVAPGAGQERTKTAKEASLGTSRFPKSIALLLSVSLALICLLGVAYWQWPNLTRTAPETQSTSLPKEPTRTEPPRDISGGVKTTSPPAVTEKQATREVPAVQSPKATDRIEPSIQAPPSIPQKAVLYEEDPNDPNGRKFIGTAVWRTQPVSPDRGQPNETAVRADVEIPERKLAMTWSLRPNTDKSLPASHCPSSEILKHRAAQIKGGSGSFG